MTAQEIIAYCLKKKQAYVDYPFGVVPVCVKVCGRIFAQIYPGPGDFKVALKCEPMAADFCRRKYAGAVVKGYHCPPAQQPYWDTVRMTGEAGDGELKAMTDEAYTAVVKNCQSGRAPG